MTENIGKILDKTRPRIKFKNRNEQFCLQVSEYKFNMFRLAKSILHNNTDAEDAVSEAILKAYTNLDTLRSMKNFKPWIMKILVNESYAISKCRKRIVYVDEIKAGEEPILNDNKELWNLVKNLEEEFRTVTILFYYEDLSLKEICRVLDLPMGTVKSRLSRARKKLKEIFDEGSSKDE
ncbi:MAG TPA: sigma-70 family RNA polymerase sigma factor [Clostridia bacterium]|nr:sigma-70 family RNA polymerase sigma factor [Clostridia bacterium]